jgi:plastocyanin
MIAGRKVSLLWVVLVLLGIAGCAGGSGSPTPMSSPGAGSTAGIAAVTITIKDFAYGDPLTVAPGSTVAVTNMDTAAHTVTADGGAVFDAQVKGSGGTATFTAPTQPGSYPYHCTYHPNMRGTLIVE